MIASAHQSRRESPPVFNLPNCLTLGRLGLAVILFVLLDLRWMATSFLLFVIAASTDWLDGYLARKRGETTRLGRILDPFVDKVVVIGAFIFLLPEEEVGLAPWMVTIVVARELLVTGLRSYLESESVPFGADWMGKMKMAMQCVAIGCILFFLGVIRGPTYLFNQYAGTLDQWGEWIMRAAIWAAVLVTIASGLSYSWRAAQLIRKGALA